MCGIVGYVGKEQAAPILLDGLSKLEYRGYDSAGIAVRDNASAIKIVKAKGRLKGLIEKTDAGHAVFGTCGIGHTRWATHGEPSETNAHPHTSDDGNVVGVHNGIIENYQELKAKLVKNGYSFYSSTDTEVAVKLVDYYYKKYEHTPVDAINHAMVRIRGSYALAMMFEEYPNEIYVARKDSPMIIGIADGNCYIASDVPAILKYTRNVYYIGNMELGRLADGKATFYNLDGDEIPKDLVEIKWDAEAAEKGGYEHFMMKEIHEQPKAILDTMNSKIKDGRIDLSDMGLSEEDIKNISQVFIVACGSAYHTGVVTQYVMEDLARIPVRVELASEFRYRRPILNKNDLVIVVSQSGETADTLAGLRLAKEQEVKTLGIVNVVGSSIAREADNVFYTLAGPEIAVATTKAYSAQLIAGYMLSIEFARVRGEITEEQYTGYITELQTIPDKIGRILEDKERIQWFAAKQANAQDIFFVGRGIDYAICLEGSLKLKEISYIHSEAYAAGELKHGTISLIEDGILVIGVLTQPELYEKTISNMVECKSRGASLMALTTVGNYSIEDTAEFTVYVPKTDEHFAASLAVVPLQLLGYYVSVARGLDVDKPRNLAKSVTVE
ncbi:glutamine--fructose-6-phosphate transaminase (isomerizing) [Clostridium sp. L2-50]|jgi:glucosamine--fructose-6-phosphate aminotransferase (isomerizing)|uniref:glutamine--fructose-6-phosphate transaminase (isomerizing) n=1 Tax=Clostridium sp. L2-50 TaxID=411489 RepID=UPI00015BD438|nr:glutamine--fructose-6-phosphate transaminase (isomerizing) [Clostridium sp. L2-50]EDO58665.1 glutamine-fructose-6-phosphate transaminase (isomerizing) [Clostridium sp. L2-50]UEA73423.1 glutamine--fructose-6-phosphate transaminase (isomerizing) [Lachnospiraceae bacterium GAM79]UEA76605.1 glutamine--fructose-6-phosphate transaminase (isomerizing) [Lachnospiraceae bacterium GAM79]